MRPRGARPLAGLFGPPLAGQVPVGPDDAVALPYSSGTMGLPKGVMLTHRNLVANIAQTLAPLQLRPEDSLVAVMPFFHIYGMQVLMNCGLRAGATIVTLPRVVSLARTQIGALAAAARTGKVLLVDGIHDLGGRHGFGAVAHSPAEPVFHHRWEAVARALLAVVAGAAGASGGEFRHAIERMEPGHYLTSGYYERWLTAAATLAVEHGLVTRSELEARAGGRFPLSGPVLAPPVADAGPDVGTPRFGVGDRVRVREWHPPGHTRCPGYVRGKAGTVVRVDGTHSVPDVEAHGTARRHEPTYSVRFDAAELWRDGQHGVWVHADLWDSYLERS